MDKAKLIDEEYIPLDKSWHIRMGVLDMLAGYTDTMVFLSGYMKTRELSDDLMSLYTASTVRSHGSKCISVGESGTLYRLLQFADWLQEGETTFGVTGTLVERKKEMCNNPEIVSWSLEKLLTLDHGTSQWASAAVICSAVVDNYNVERIKTSKPKLNLTYEAADHWLDCQEKGEMWDVRYDGTIATQAMAYLGLLKTGEMDFTPEQPEDYCFARAFGIITEDEIEHYREKWSSLEGHESKRVDEMEAALNQYNSLQKITSKDHRVVQAIAMLWEYQQKAAVFEYENAVNKSWPEFWKFLNDSRRLAA